MSKLPSRTSVEYLKDTFRIGHEAYENSRIEAKAIWNLYHNRHYTEEQLNVLRRRGQPAETFNVIKLFTRMMIGYYSTVVNTVTATPEDMEDIPTTSLINDVVDHIFRDNNFIDEGEDVKLEGMISGLLCCFVNVKDTGKKDQFGRPLYKVVLQQVPSSEIIIDPMSVRSDYTVDARWIHRYKWVSEEKMLTLVGQKKMDEMEEYYNFTDAADVDFDVLYPERFSGIYRIYNNYLVVHSIVIDEVGDSWSVLWHDDTIIKKEKITNKIVKFPYRIVKVHKSEETEYYGVFRDVAESQKAINQALIKLQLMVATQKAFVQDGAVEDLAEFTHAFNRVSGVVPVLSLAGIKIEALTREAMEQYSVIDKAFDRIQRVLGINDSFLGMAFASDSGRKVKLQQNAAIIALRYLTGKIQLFYRLLGWDVVNLVQQYYTATQELRIADDATGERWAMLNIPEQIWTGEIDENGQPIMDFEYEPVIDPASGEQMVDEQGNMIMAPIPREDTEIAFTNVDIEITSTSYNDEDERNQLMLETVLSGPTGQFLMQVNPAGYLKAAGLSLKSVKTKNSPEIARIFEETAMMLGGNPQAQDEASQMAQGQPSQNNQVPRSQELKLPQNTNEGPA